MAQQQKVAKNSREKWGYSGLEFDYSQRGVSKITEEKLTHLSSDIFD